MSSELEERKWETLATGKCSVNEHREKKSMSLSIKTELNVTVHFLIESG